MLATYGIVLVDIQALDYIGRRSISSPSRMEENSTNVLASRAHATTQRHRSAYESL
jgi:hypothetical protein